MTLTKEEKEKYFKILGLFPDSTIDEIQNAYSRLREMYASEISLLSSIVGDFPTEKIEDVLLDLEEAKRKILAQMEYERSSANRMNQKPPRSQPTHEAKKKETNTTQPIMEDIKEKLAEEEAKLSLDYVRKIEHLMTKGNALCSALNEIMKQLQYLERRLSIKNAGRMEIFDKLTCIKSKVDCIRKVYSENMQNDLEYGWAAASNESREPLAEQMALLCDDINLSQGAPTQVQIDQFAGFERRIVSLQNAAQEIREKDIPEMNTLLQELNLPLITISEILHDLRPRIPK